MTEANISKENSSFEIEGYKVIPDKGRESSTKMSRTAVIVRSDLTYKVRDDLVNLEISEVWVEIGEHRKKITLIGVVYREHRRWGEGAQTNKVGEKSYLIIKCCFL